jgi:hypothetical protein
MPTFPVPDTGEALTIGGAAVIVLFIVQAILTASKADHRRWGPLLALVTGVALMVGYAALDGFATVLVQNALMTGILAGASAMAGHDVVNSAGIDL